MKMVGNHDDDNTIEKKNENENGDIFYHDVDEICWPQPIRSPKLGHVTGQGPVPDLVGRCLTREK